jgi:hypothetical protein
MSPPDPLVFLQTLLTKEFGTHPHPPSEADHAKARAPLVITLSRDHGSLGEEVAQRLSQCLGIVVYDQEILNRVAKRAKTDKFHFKGHDEQTSAALTSFLHSLVSGKSGTLQDYRRHLGEVVAEIARTDGIIIGRGAHLILGARKALRIRVVGSRLICAQRIASTCQIPVPEAEQQVVEINKKRHESVIELYGSSVERCSLEYAPNFDLVINTDRISVEGAVGIVMLAIREAGFALEAFPSKA